MRRYLILILSAILILSLTTQLYTGLSIFMTIILFYCMMDKFGKGVVLLETMSFYACIIYLIMPLVGYSIYNSQSRITVIWAKVMPVPFETYYSFILPATCTYVIGLFLPNYMTGHIDEGDKMVATSARIKMTLSIPGRKGIVLLVAGLAFYSIKVFVPGSLAAVANFGYMLIFPGLLYVYFQPKLKGKIFIYLLVGAFFIRDAINTGMFTVTVYMSLTIVSFFLLGRKIRLPIKLATVAVAISALFLLQLVKGSFRNKTGKASFDGSRAEIFRNIAVEKAGNFSAIFSPNAFFPIYSRLNQGWTTALVLRRMPTIQPFDEGKSIYLTLAAAVVPRFLWPDKPESGGVYNMKHFAGYNLKGWSVNIGPTGEAYGNFGPAGGIVYMLFFGLFIGWAYISVFRLSRNLPLLILWIPLLFFEVTYSMENDTLQALNSLIKATVFLWLLNKFFPSLFMSGKKANTILHESRSHFRNNRAGRSIPG